MWHQCFKHKNYSVYQSAYPYEKESLDLHREITDAARPARSAVQSKNMWKESDISPKLVWMRDIEKQNANEFIQNLDRNISVINAKNVLAKQILSEQLLEE